MPSWVAHLRTGGRGLDWRPHAWLNAASGSGKSWLIERVSKPLLGPWATALTAHVTPAAFRRIDQPGGQADYF